MNTEETDKKTAERVAQVVHEGQRTVPVERTPMVSKPSKIEAWRIFKIMSEFVEGFDLIRRYTLAASFFGSARTAPGEQAYEEAVALSGRLAKKGFAVITGGSSGIMQAANKGAFEAGGASIGLNINLPNAQRYNPFLTDRFVFDHFFVRKVMLTFASEVYIYFPGGFGTLDEFFEIVTLVQTKKIRRVPIILVGKSYWEPLLENFKQVLLHDFKTIDEQDMHLFTVVDSVDEAYDCVIKNVPC